ncbi:hypothetical protein BDV12DRAFT_199456 [Aspergillus spectabilis]
MALMATLHSVYIAAAVSKFFPSVVATLAYGRNETYALTALGSPTILIQKQERYWHIAYLMVICLAANIIVVATLNTAARFKLTDYVVMVLMPGSFYAAATVVLSWVGGSLSQPTIERASAIALINAVRNTSNVWCSYFYGSSRRYLIAFLLNFPASALAILAATAPRRYLTKEKHKLEMGIDTGRNGPIVAQQAARFSYTL